MDYLLNDDESDNNLARKIFIFSNPGIFLLSCPPPCGHFLIQQSTAGGLSYKVKKAVNSSSSASSSASLGNSSKKTCLVF